MGSIEEIILEDDHDPMESEETLIAAIHISEENKYVVASVELKLSNPVHVADTLEMKLMVYPYLKIITILQESGNGKDSKSTDGVCNMSCDLFVPLIESKCFKLVTHPAKQASNHMVLDIVLESCMFLDLEQPFQSVNFLPRKNVIKLFSLLDISLFNEYDESSQPEVSHITTMYEMLRDAHSHMRLPWSGDTPDALLPELREYQKQSISWMLSREHCQTNKQELHPLFSPFQTSDGVLIYAHRSGGFFVKDKVCASEIRGGILADEMGLGKTIEILVLILSNPKITSSNLKMPLENDNRDESVFEEQVFNVTNGFAANSSTFVCVCGKIQGKYPCSLCVECALSQHPSCIFYDTDYQSDPYICPYCTVKKMVQSRATLIVSPASISSQWYEEIEKHTRPGTFKVFCYRGVKEDKFIPPEILADNDIVIVSYETFRTETKFIDLNPNYFSNRRSHKKYATLPSPLASIHWWRICLDEAQMVESSTCKSAEMALRLKADNRWCVTGTPIQKSVTDLFGLFLFLKHEPYCEKRWFNESLFKPFCCKNVQPFVDALMPIFWRTLKKDVYAQIGLMPPITVNVMLKFSALEKYFYDQQHQFCTKEFLTKTRAFDRSSKLKSLDRKILSQIMIPLRRLRQACCHPQAVPGQFCPDSKKIMTMQEISAALVKKAKRDCEVSQRSYISNLNGFAGLSLVQNHLYDAMKAYVTALMSIVKHKSDVRTDAMLQIHILNNLVTEIKKNDIQVSLSTFGNEKICSLHLPDDKRLALPNDFTCLEDLETKEESLRKEYLIQHTKLLSAAENEMKKHFKEVQKIKSEDLPSMKNRMWFQYILDNASLWKKDEEIYLAAKDIFRKHSNGLSPNLITTSFTDLNGLLYVCFDLVEKLMSSRDKLCQVVQSLMNNPSVEDVTAAKQCHLGQNPIQYHVKCKYCKAEDVFDTYECSLFNIKGNIQINKKRKLDVLLEDDASSSSSSGDEEEDRKEKNGEQSEDQQEGNGNIPNKKTGTWADGALEKVLKNMLSIATSKRLPPEVSAEATKHFELFEAMKKEFKALRSAWMQASDTISAYDELAMASSRYENNGSEYVSVGSNTIPSFVVPTLCRQYASMQEDLEKNVDQDLGRLLFLRNAVKGYSDDIDENSESCPICRNSFDSKWTVLCCGHRLCYACLNALMKGSRGNNSVHCPMCRVVTKDCDVLFFDFERERKATRVFKGSFSSKIFAIIETLVGIKNENKDAKSIVFSSFDGVLKIVMEALKENDILFVDLTKRKNFEINLQKFKNEANLNVLILPVRAGANGLNIVEAQNVLLIEPLLNPGLVEQAIGRIYRIGQKKQTKVYKFIMESSIEEKIKESEKPQTFETNKDIEDCLTLGELTEFFIS